MSLCQRFRNLDPLTIDGYSAIEVFTLVRDLNEYLDRNTENEEINKSNKKVHRVQVID